MTLTLPFPQKLPQRLASDMADRMVLVAGYLSTPDAEEFLSGIVQQGATIAPHLVQYLPAQDRALPRSVYSPPVPTRIGPLVQLLPGALSVPTSDWGGVVNWIADSVDYPAQPLRGWLHWQNPDSTLRCIYMLFTGTGADADGHMTVFRTWDITTPKDRATGVGALWGKWEDWGL